MTMQDKRVWQSFPDRTQAPYMQALELRVSALQSTDFDLAAPTFAVLPEQSNIIRVGVQLREKDGTATARRTLVHVWYADSQYATPTLLMPGPSDGWALSDDAGYILLAPTYASAGTFWLHVHWQDRIYLAPAITFA